MTPGWARCWGVLGVLATLVLWTGPAWASTVTILGNSLWDADRVAAIVGSPPATATRLPKWADDALKRLVAAYGAAGYTAARGWTRVQDDHVDIEIDEGRIGRVVFRGPNPLLKVLLAQAVALPERVLDKAAVEAQLAQFEELQGLHGAAWTVREGDEWVRQVIPGAVRAQVLVIAIEPVQPLGFDLAMGFDPIHGLLVSPSYARPDLAAPGDRFEVTATVAFPVKEYLFDSDPKLRWVYGDLGVQYQMRPLGKTSVSPRFGVAGLLSQTPRLDRGLEQLMVEKTAVRVDLVLSQSKRWIPSIGVFASQATVLRTLFWDDADPADLANPPKLDSVFRGGLTAGLEAFPRSTLIRTDLRPKVLVEGAFGLSDAFLPYVRFVGDVRGAVRLRSNLLLLGLHAGFVAGDTRIYDDLRVAGRRQRTPFHDLYYTRALVQGEVDLRFKVLRDLQIGALYQHTLFEDTVTDSDAPVLAWANSFGPGVHLLVLDQIAIDVYWAMGFAPPSYEPFSPNGKRFGQTISLSMQTAY